MISESQLKDHRWYHHLFTRKMGTFYASCFNVETGEGAKIGRLVRYCPFCKTDYHEGGEIQSVVDRIAGAPQDKPELTLRVNNVVPFEEKKPE